MKLLPIVAGALIAGPSAAHASPLPVGCAFDVLLSVPDCPPGALDCILDAASAFPDDPDAALPDCDPGEAAPSGDAAPPELRPGAAPPADPAGALDVPDGYIRSSLSHRPLRHARPPRAPGTTPSRPGGDPTSIVQRPPAPRGTERDSVDNPGHGAMWGAPRPAGPPGLSAGASRGRSGTPPPGRDPALPRIVPGPSGPASAGSKLTTLAPTGPLRAGRRSWAAMVGAAVAAEAGLLWLAVGLALRRRARSKR